MELVIRTMFPKSDRRTAICSLGVGRFAAELETQDLLGAPFQYHLGGGPGQPVFVGRHRERIAQKGEHPRVGGIGQQPADLVVVGTGHQRADEAPGAVGGERGLEFGVAENLDAIEGQTVGIEETAITPVFGGVGQRLQERGIGREDPILPHLLQIDLASEGRSTSQTQDVHALAGADSQHVGPFEAEGGQRSALRGHLGARQVGTRNQVSERLQQAFHARRLDGVVDRSPQEPGRIGPLEADRHVGSEDLDRDHLAGIEPPETHGPVGTRYADLITAFGHDQPSPEEEGQQHQRPCGSWVHRCNRVIRASGPTP